MKHIFCLILPAILFCSCKTSRKAESATQSSAAIQTAIVNHTEKSDSLLSVIEGKADRIIIRRSTGSEPGKIVIFQNPAWKSNRSRNTAELSVTKTDNSEVYGFASETETVKTRKSGPEIVELLVFLLLLGIILFIFRLPKRI